MSRLKSVTADTVVVHTWDRRSIRGVLVEAEPTERLLHTLRDIPAYTNEELDAGYAAVLADLQHLPPERARQLDEVATSAEIGGDAHALGLEHLERGDLEQAAPWRRLGRVL